MTVALSAPDFRSSSFGLALVILILAFGTADSREANEPNSDPSEEFISAIHLLESGDHTSGWRKMRDLADSGDDDAQFFFGNIFFFPDNGVQDFEQAFNWYQKAARQGHAEAQHHIGIMYSRGSFVTADQEQAVNWYSKAAIAGSAYAQFDLAYRYQSGRGVEQDLDKAKHWYELAAAQGHSKAASNLRGLIARGHGSAEDPDLGKLRDAAAAGDVRAQWQLYQTYSKDSPRLHKDPEKAAHWLTEAGKRRHPDALSVIIRSRFFQGCQASCFDPGEASSGCNEDCTCMINKLQNRYTPNELLDLIIEATQGRNIDSLIELIVATQQCGGVPV